VNRVNVSAAVATMATPSVPTNVVACMQQTAKRLGDMAEEVEKYSPSAGGGGDADPAFGAVLLSRMKEVRAHAYSSQRSQRSCPPQPPADHHSLSLLSSSISPPRATCVKCQALCETLCVADQLNILLRHSVCVHLNPRVVSLGANDCMYECSTLNACRPLKRWTSKRPS
jgi:hypothetical protein